MILFAKDPVIADWVVFPRFLMDYSVGFTAKWTYTLLYNELLNRGEPDGDGHYFLCRRPLPNWQGRSTKPVQRQTGLCRSWSAPDL